MHLEPEPPQVEAAVEKTTSAETEEDAYFGLTTAQPPFPEREEKPALPVDRTLQTREYDCSQAHSLANTTPAAGRHAPKAAACPGDGGYAATAPRG